MRVLVVVAFAAFWIYCMIDVLQSDAAKVRNLPKIAWGLIVVLFGVLGSVGWIIAGRPARAAGAPGVFRAFGPRTPEPRRLAPDDDPDFLRGLGGLKPPPPVDPDEPPTRQA